MTTNINYFSSNCSCQSITTGDGRNFACSSGNYTRLYTYVLGGTSLDNPVTYTITGRGTGCSCTTTVRVDCPSESQVGDASNFGSLSCTNNNYRFSASQTKVSVGTSITFQTLNGISCNWNFGDGGTASGSTASHGYSRGGTPTVRCSNPSNPSQYCQMKLGIYCVTPTPTPGLVTLSGYVFLDTNSDGKKDGGEICFEGTVAIWIDSDRKPDFQSTAACNLYSYQARAGTIHEIYVYPLPADLSSSGCTTAGNQSYPCPGAHATMSF